VKVLVCGGRDYSDTDQVVNTLDRLDAERLIHIIIHGGARGADSEAAQWADLRQIQSWRFPADWKTHGKAAGPIRNQQMIDDGNPDLVVAFPGGKGTEDMKARARAAGVEVIEVEA
jgi:hypothetical protein